MFHYHDDIVKYPCIIGLLIWYPEHCLIRTNSYNFSLLFFFFIILFCRCMILLPNSRLYFMLCNSCVDLSIWVMLMFCIVASCYFTFVICCFPYVFKCIASLWSLSAILVVKFQLVCAKKISCHSHCIAIWAHHCA